MRSSDLISSGPHASKFLPISVSYAPSVQAGEEFCPALGVARRRPALGIARRCPALGVAQRCSALGVARRPRRLASPGAARRARRRSARLALGVARRRSARLASLGAPGVARRLAMPGAARRRSAGAILRRDSRHARFSGCTIPARYQNVPGLSRALQAGTHFHQYGPRFLVSLW